MAIIPKIFVLAALVMAMVACNESTRTEVKTVYYPGTKTIKQQIEYKSGKKNGLFAEFYRNGIAKTRQFYKNDTLNDSTVLYHENGRVATIQLYKMGKREGCWKKFNKTGKLYWQTCFADDRYEGEAFEYSYRTLKPVLRFHYLNGDKHGKQETFYSNGKPKSVVYYHRGFPTEGTQEWEENGEERNLKIDYTISEKNTTALDGKLRYFIYFKNHLPEDRVWEMIGDSDTSFVTRRALPEVNGAFVYEEMLLPGQMVMRKVPLLITRSSLAGNPILQKFTLTIAGSN